MQVIAPLLTLMKTALFTNFTDREFIGYWNGKGKKFPPGASLYMPDYLAAHFAKHLTNRELLLTDKQGNLIHANGDKMTSPKFPEQVPMFMEFFNKAYKPDETEELGSVADDIDSLIGSANKNKQEKGTMASMPETVTAPSMARPVAAPKIAQDPTQPQVITPVDDGEDEDDTKSFNGKPVEAA